MTTREFNRRYADVCIALALALLCWTWGFFTHVSWCRVHHMPTDRYHHSATEAVRR